MPLLGTIASDSSIWTRRKLHWSFQAFPSSDYDHEGFLDILKVKGAGVKKLAIVFEQSPFSIASKDFAEKTATAMGLTVETYGYSPGAQDFPLDHRAHGQLRRRDGLDGRLLRAEHRAHPPDDRTWLQSRSRYHFIQAADGVTKDALGANAEGIFGRSAWEASAETPTNKAFVAAYQAKFNRLPSYHSAAAYAAGQVLAAAITAKRRRSQARSATTLRPTAIETVLGTFRVNETGQQTGYRYVATQWQGGISRVVGEFVKSPIEWPKPKWS